MHTPVKPSKTKRSSSLKNRYGKSDRTTSSTILISSRNFNQSSTKMVPWKTLPWNNKSYRHSKMRWYTKSGSRQGRDCILVFTLSSRTCVVICASEIIHHEEDISDGEYNQTPYTHSIIKGMVTVVTVLHYIHCSLCLFKFSQNLPVMSQVQHSLRVREGFWKVSTFCDNPL
jgi:hypothetical protein